MTTLVLLACIASAVHADEAANGSTLSGSFVNVGGKTLSAPNGSDATALIGGIAAGESASLSGSTLTGGGGDSNGGFLDFGPGMSVASAVTLVLLSIALVAIGVRRLMSAPVS